MGDRSFITRKYVLNVIQGLYLLKYASVSLCTDMSYKEPCTVAITSKHISRGVLSGCAISETSSIGNSFSRVYDVNNMNTYIYLYYSMLVLMHAQQELNEQ